MVVSKSCIILLILTYCKSALASTVSRDDGNNQKQGWFYVGGFLGGVTASCRKVATEIPSALLQGSTDLALKPSFIYSHGAHAQIYAGYKIEKGRFFLSVEAFFALSPQLLRTQVVVDAVDGEPAIDIRLRSRMPILGIVSRDGIAFFNNTLSLYLKTGFFTSFLAIDREKFSGYDAVLSFFGGPNSIVDKMDAYLFKDDQPPQHPVMIHGGIVLGLGTEWYFRPNWSIRAEATAFIHYTVVLPMFTCGIGVQWYPFMLS